MTFLDYIAERLMGPPVSHSGGRSYWLCPFHNDTRPSFCTLHKEGCKDRFRCYACGAWGDEYDLLKLFFDKEIDRRKDRLDKSQEDYDREVPPEPETRASAY